MSTTTPRVAKFPNVEIDWSDGTKFNGFCLISLVPPTLGGTSWTEGDFGKIYPTDALPAFATIPIQDGFFNTFLGLYYNEDISPPSTTYIARFYDTTKRLIAGPGSPFTVSADPLTITIPTLTVPNTGGTAPIPN